MGTKKDFAELIRHKLAGDRSLAAEVQYERTKAMVSEIIYEARTDAGLTQQQLAARAGMRQSAVARLEDTDYDGHNMKTLERIAFALGKCVEISFVDQEPALQIDFGFVTEYSPKTAYSPAEVDLWQPEITIGAINYEPAA
jgi:transcriptional regulator with XRE-family HTH domain